MVHHPCSLLSDRLRFAYGQLGGTTGTMRLDRLIGAAGAALLIMVGGTAWAHPHVWIDNVTTFQFTGGKITAIKLHWTFDELFGTGIIDQFDKNKNKKFEPAELAALQKGAFDHLKEYGYFTWLTVDGTERPVKAVTGFAASVDKKGNLVYEFIVPLDRPVDPVASKLIVGVYDPSYFVEVDTGGKGAVRYEGNGGIACRTEQRENPGKTIYMGQINPIEMFLTCEGKP